MAKSMRTIPPGGGKPVRAHLVATSFVASPVFARFEEAAQALDAAIAAEEALHEADIHGDDAGEIGFEAFRQVTGARASFDAVAKAPVVLEGDDKMVLAAGLVSLVLDMDDTRSRCNTAIAVMAMRPGLKVRSHQPQARVVDRLIDLAFARLERLEELMFFNATRFEGDAAPV